MMYPAVLDIGAPKDASTDVDHGPDGSVCRTGQQWHVTLVPLPGSRADGFSVAATDRDVGILWATFDSGVEDAGANDHLTLRFARVTLDGKVLGTVVVRGAAAVSGGTIDAYETGYVVAYHEEGRGGVVERITSSGPSDGATLLLTIPGGWPTSIRATGDEFAVLYWRGELGSELLLERFSRRGSPLDDPLVIGTATRTAMAAVSGSYAVAWSDGAVEQAAMQFIRLKAQEPAAIVRFPPRFVEFSNFDIGVVAGAEGYLLVERHPGPELNSLFLSRLPRTADDWTTPVSVRGYEGAISVAAAESPRTTLLAAIFEGQDTASGPLGDVAIQPLGDDLQPAGPRLLLDSQAETRVPVAVAQNGTTTIVAWTEQASKELRLALVRPCN